MRVEEGKKGNGRYELTAEEKLLLEEYKLRQEGYYRSESEYSKRENFFILTKGVIIAAAVQAVREDLCWVAILISLFGIWLSAIWFFMQARSHRHSEAKIYQMDKIGNKLKFIGRVKPKPIKGDGWEERSTWCLRKSIPILFLILWIFIFLYSLNSLYYLFRPQCLQRWFIVLLFVIITTVPFCIYRRCKDPD